MPSHGLARALGHLCELILVGHRPVLIRELAETLGQLRDLMLVEHELTLVEHRRVQIYKPAETLRQLGKLILVEHQRV